MCHLLSWHSLYCMFIIRIEHRELLVQDLWVEVKWQSFGSWNTLLFICWLILLAWGNRQDWKYPPFPGSSYSCSDSQPWCVLSYMSRVETSAESKPSRSGAIRPGSFYTSSWASACPCSPQLSICLYFHLPALEFKVWNKGYRITKVP